MKKILIFVNPHSRKGAIWGEKVREWAQQQGFTILNENDGADVQKHIADFKDQAVAVIVGGGDGSVNNALPALMASGLPLLLLPLGTANNLARTLGVPTDPEKAFALLTQGTITEIDVGLINQIPFVNVIGLGLSTQVNRLSRTSTKRLLGVFAFIWTALKVGLRMKPFRIFLDCDGKKHSAKTWQISVCNGRNYGSGLTIHQEATLRDEILHGISTEVEKWWHAFSLIPALISGRFRAEHDVTVFKGKVIKIDTHHSMSVDVDGDIKTHTPAEITVASKALKVYVPKTAANPATG